MRGNLEEERAEVGELCVVRGGGRSKTEPLDEGVEFRSDGSGGK